MQEVWFRRIGQGNTLEEVIHKVKPEWQRVSHINIWKKNIPVGKQQVQKFKERNEAGMVEE